MLCKRCGMLMSKTVDKKGNVTWDCSNSHCNQVKNLEEYLKRKLNEKEKK